MKDIVIVVITALVLGWGAVIGSLMLLSPDRYSDFMDRITRADKWSVPSLGRKGGWQLEKRMAGLVILAATVAMGRVVLLGVIRKLRGGHLPGVARVASAHGEVWATAAIGGVCALLGLYTILRPTAVLQWAASHLRDRMFRGQPDAMASRVLLRVLGAFFLAVGLLAMLTSLMYK